MTNSQTLKQSQDMADAAVLSWRFILARRVFQIMTLISLPAFLAASYYAFDEGTYTYIPIYILLLAFMLVVSFWKRVNDKARMWGIIGLIYFVVLLDLYTEGRGSLAHSFLLVFSFMGAIFFGRRGAILSAVFGLLTMIVFAYSYAQGLLPDYQVSSLIVSGWISNTVIIALLMITMTFSVDYLVREMTSFLVHRQQLNQVIDAERANLEERVRDRTAAAESARADAEFSASEAQAVRRDLEIQIWLSMGQTQLADVMRGEQDILQLAGNVISQVSQYIGAQGGALFLLYDKTLTLAGRYAFAGRPGFDENFQLGEGLVGQAALDGKLLYLDNIPSDTLVISTGLMEITPCQIIAVPFRAYGEVVGVLELAALSAFKQSHFDLLERTSESIGVAFCAAQMRQRHEDILTAIEYQARELLAQDEELRTANEELQAQVEDVKNNSEKKR